jgi:tetratricopeptide (TPR) repeat protein
MKAERRHELKTNALYLDLIRAWGWVQVHRTPVIVGVLLVAAAGVLMHLLISRAHSRPQEAWTELSSAASEEQYRKVLEDYPSTDAANEARMELYRILFEAGKLDQARALAQEVLDRVGGNQYLSARALLALGSAAEQERKTEEAVRLYERLLRDCPAPGFKDEAEARVKALRMPNRPVPPALAFTPLPVTEETVPIPTQPTTMAVTPPATGPATRPANANE